MSRTTREEHRRICDQCSAMERELERLRAILNEAEDQVMKLEVKSFPGRKRMLAEAVEREANARSAYSEAQHRLDDIRRQERILRMKMRREESEVSVDDIPDVSEIGEVEVEDIPDAEIEHVPEIEVADMNMPEIEDVVIDGDEGASKLPKEQVAGSELEQKNPSQRKSQDRQRREETPTYCENDHADFGEHHEEFSEHHDDAEWGYGDDVEEEGGFSDRWKEKGKDMWGQAKRAWRVLNRMDVPSDESLRLEIMSQIYEIETELRRIRLNVGKVKVLGAIRATNDLANLRPKIQRLIHLVDSARKECPDVRFPEIDLPDADGFSLMEDVLSKDGDNDVSTVIEIDRFLARLPKLKEAVKSMPEREGVRDQL